jgi:hypothetical protein
MLVRCDGGGSGNQHVRNLVAKWGLLEPLCVRLQESLRGSLASLWPGPAKDLRLLEKVGLLASQVALHGRGGTGTGTGTGSGAVSAPVVDVAFMYALHMDKHDLQRRLLWATLGAGNAPALHLVAHTMTTLRALCVRDMPEDEQVLRQAYARVFQNIARDEDSPQVMEAWALHSFSSKAARHFRHAVLMDTLFAAEPRRWYEVGYALLHSWWEYDVVDDAPPVGELLVWMKRCCVARRWDMTDPQANMTVLNLCVCLIRTCRHPQSGGLVAYLVHAFPWRAPARGLHVYRMYDSLMKYADDCCWEYKYAKIWGDTSCASRVPRAIQHELPSLASALCTIPLYTRCDCFDSDDNWRHSAHSSLDCLLEHAPAAAVERLHRAGGVVCSACALPDPLHAHCASLLRRWCKGKLWWLQSCQGF